MLAVGAACLERAGAYPIAGAPGDEAKEQDASPSLTYQLARARKQEQLLLADLKQQQEEFDYLFADAQLLEKENRKLHRKRALLDAVQSRIDQKDMERSVAGSIEVLTPAFSSSKPYRDRHIPYAAVALSLALIAGGVTTFLGRKRRTHGPTTVSIVAA